MSELIRDIKPDGDINIYPEQDPMDLDDAGAYSFRHVLRMTKENLHSKADIANQLGARDKEIDELRSALTAQAEREKELEESLQECACDLSNEISDRYPEASRNYPVINRRYERDMEVVRRAQSLLTNKEDGE